MLKSLFLNNKRSRFKIFIIHNGLASENQNAIARFIQSENQEVEFLLIDEKQIENAPVSHHVSLATYYRILIPVLIGPDIKKVLFLDSDLLVRGDISELWETDLQDSYVAAAPEFIDEKYKIALGMNPSSGYFNAGVLLMNLEKWRKVDMTTRILKFIDANHEKLISWDQDALNVMFENKWKKISPEWNVGHNFFRGESLAGYFRISEIEFNNYVRSPKIVHFSGGAKPWLFEISHPFKSEYLEYKERTPWRKLKLIGEPTGFQKFNKRIGNVYRAFKSKCKEVLFADRKIKSN
jgi:lipopolysaccharide biosynthesis glycosyltransferase